MIVRQRLRDRSSPLAFVGLALLVPLALALVWYGAMLIGLALKAPPEDVNAISGYRDAYDFLAGLETDDVTGEIRLITALAGLGAFLIFGWLAWKQLPRPYLARGELTLGEGERGTLTVEPRAIERVAEAAARGHPAVADASGRYGDDGIDLHVDVGDADDLAGTLQDVRRRLGEALQRHDLPEVPVRVTLTGFERQRRRELE